MDRNRVAGTKTGVSARGPATTLLTPEKVGGNASIRQVDGHALAWQALEANKCSAARVDLRLHPHALHLVRQESWHVISECD